ncbi:MAG: T9SS type A sorting domain-containing protein, partial [Melioribacteraceae bacterium]|nr:T9SS type A sorting domain-containing protein [Melioribacteraceae bacterium]
LGPENGLPDPVQQRIGRIGLTISKSNPSILYALYNDGTQPFGLYKSSDGGSNWIKTSETFKGSGSFSWYFGQVRVDPIDPETVFVLDVAFFKSSDNGFNWDFTYGYSGPSNLHVDHHALAFHPENPNYILSGNDGGINISTNGGETWSQPLHLPITQFYEIGLDKQNPERFYGGTQDNNTIRTVTGLNDDWERIFGGDGFYVIVDPNNSNIIYAESQFGGLGKSTDGGSIFSAALQGIDLDERTNWSTPVVMDPNNSSVLYYGTHTLYRTTDGAESWSPISPKLTDHNSDRRLGTLTTIAVAPTNSEVIYVGTDDGYVWVSSDYGSNWKNISSDLPFRWVTRVAVDPTDENIVYATFSGLRWADPEPRVFRSIDMGNTWTNISSNLPDAPVNAFEIDRNNRNILYLGNDVGVFISYNSGQSWEILADDLPIVVVNDMKIHPTDNYLAIGTHGRGMYKVALNNLVDTPTYENNISSEYTLSQNYPNPFNPTTTIKYSIPNLGANGELSNVKLTIYDLLGRVIATLVNQEQQPGNYEVVFNSSAFDQKFSSGIYIYTLKIGDFIDSKKMVLIK